MSSAPVRNAWLKAPCCWGLLGAIALVALVERYVASDPDYTGNVAASWRFKDRHVKPRARRRAILCFGDSMLQFGILPRVLQERTGRQAYSFAIHSGPAPASYFLLRRALESGAHPWVVVADFSRIILGDGPASKARPYPWAELLHLRETAELAWSARDADLFASITLGQLLPSYRSRFEIRASIWAALEGRESAQRRITLGLRRNWSQNAGAQVNVKNPDFRDGPAPPAEPPRSGTWRCDPVNALYLEKFLGLAARHMITVVWLLPPVSPGTQAAWEHSGDEAIFTRFILATQARHANLVVLDGRHAGYGPTLFTDGVHLDRDGASMLSAGIGDVLRKHSAPARIPSRWVALPAPSTAHLVTAHVEDVGQSIAIAPALQARSRR